MHPILDVASSLLVEEEGSPIYNVLCYCPSELSSPLFSCFFSSILSDIQLKRMFCVSLYTVKLLHTCECLIDAFIICPLFPFGTTRSIFLKSPLSTTVIPPKGFLSLFSSLHLAFQSVDNPSLIYQLVLLTSLSQSRHNLSFENQLDGVLKNSGVFIFCIACLQITPLM
jgi:hypothetical protein